MSDMPELSFIIASIAIAIIAIISTAWFLYGLPVWRVWAMHKEGQADLAQAQIEQQIQVAKAKGRLDAAELNKKAAIIEADAISEQIKRIGINLTQHDLYLKWQWIKMMEERPKNSVIYVPTEAGLPILEAGRTVDQFLELVKKEGGINSGYQNFSNGG
jgi:hypothetical protein